jgi:hypothetical protein
MKFILTILSILSPLHIAGQTLVCNCPTDKFINSSNTPCNVTKLKKGGSLYYQFNCDSVWLTLENSQRQKHIIYSMAGETYKELYGYTFRLGFQLSKEFEKTLLFRKSCPANGPCDFVLINKETGQTEKKFGELIYDHKGPTFYDFLIYFSDSSLSSITLYYVDTKKTYKIATYAKHFNATIPEYLFNDITLKKDTLELVYDTEDDVKQKILIDLTKYHR